ARERGNEGLMVKDPRSPYRPGRRGMEWLKVKRPLRTIDVVVTAVEWGHGKRRGVLSDYTFAIRDGERLLNIGKAYSGLTDKEIAEMTKYILEHTVQHYGRLRTVVPDPVIEVASSVYFAAFWSFGHGQTPGMRVRRLRLVDGNGRDLGFGRALARAAVLLFGMGLGIVPLSILLDHDGVAIHDRLFGTRVFRMTT